MFQRLPELEHVDCVTVYVDGKAVRARMGDTVAAALLEAGVRAFHRAPFSSAARGPYCMMGVCFDCLVTIDGIGNRQACMARARDGMRIDTQTTKRKPWQ